MLEFNPPRNSFLYRFTALNIFGLALLVAAFFQGWVSQIYDTDSSHITSIIAITFLGGLVVSLYKAIGINQLWNQIQDTSHELRWFIRGKTVESLGLRLSANISIVSHIAVVLLLLGISGTMVGIILALKSTEALSTGDQGSMVAAILLLFKGVYVKFYASLVGIIGHTWLLTNYHMLTSMSRRLLARMSEHV